MTKLFIALLLLSLTLHAKDGGQGTGNGGDGIALEVKAIATVLVKHLEKNEVEFKSISVDKFSKAVENTIVQSTSEKLFDHQQNEKTAINQTIDGVATIKINKPAYDSLHVLSRQQLIFHEYLGIIGIEKSDDYRYSSKLDTILSRPIYGFCQAKSKKTICTMNFRFDTLTRAIDGAYHCRNEDLLLDIGSLEAKYTEWKPVRIWRNKHSYSAGFEYNDQKVNFEIPSAPVVYLNYDFEMKTDGRDLKGKCGYNYF